MRRWQFWLGIIVSVFFLWVALRGLRIGDVWLAIVSANYWWLVPAIAVYFLAVLARAWRWHYLLRPVQKVPIRVTFPVVTIGYMGNNIFPARAGELLRAVVMRKKESIPAATSLGTIAVERAFDGVVMLGFVILNLPELARLTSSSGLAGSIRTVALLGVAVFLGATLLFILMAIIPAQFLRLTEFLIQRLLPQRWHGRAAGVAEGFFEGFAALRSPVDVFMVLVTTIVIWLFETVKYWFVMQAFPFVVSFFALMLMNGIVNLATTLPSAPGYIGTFDAPGIAVLEAYGVPGATAAAYTLVLHAALWLPITILGAYFMFRESLSWSQVQLEMADEVTA